MSRLTALNRRWQKLGEAREIVSAMKSLAFMEVRRLGRFLDVQRQVVDIAESAAADFLSFHPQCLPVPQPGRRVFLLLGSERGFCGSFNETLVQHLEHTLSSGESELAGIVACGQKLCGKLEGHSGLLAKLDGAAVIDEVGTTVIHLVKVLNELQPGEDALALTAIHHDPEQDGVVVSELLPPFGPLRREKAHFPYAPQLNLPPEDFLLELIDQYLFAILHEILYVSLMAENQQRMQHLEGAIRYLDENLESLQRRGNQLRQEEITEEIEMILLNADRPAPPPGGRGSDEAKD